MISLILHLETIFNESNFNIDFPYKLVHVSFAT
jgi:hypothetical protein